MVSILSSECTIFWYRMPTNIRISSGVRRGSIWSFLRILHALQSGWKFETSLIPPACKGTQWSACMRFPSSNFRQASISCERGHPAQRTCFLVRIRATAFFQESQSPSDSHSCSRTEVPAPAAQSIHTLCSPFSILREMANRLGSRSRLHIEQRIVRATFFLYQERISPSLIGLPFFLTHVERAFPIRASR